MVGHPEVIETRLHGLVTRRQLCSDQLPFPRHSWSMTLDPVYNTGIPGSMRVIVMMILGRMARKSFSGIVAVALATCVCTLGQSRSGPVDPGARGGPAGAGTALKGLTADETAFFQDGEARFAEIEVVTKGAN